MKKTRETKEYEFVSIGIKKELNKAMDEIKKKTGKTKFYIANEVFEAGLIALNWV